jgi:hypothetical protein
VTGTSVVITTPVTIPALTAVTVIAGVGATATNPSVAGTDSISVSTSSDATPVPSSPTYNISGAASKVVVAGGNNQSVAVGTAFATLSATVEDAAGNPVGTPTSVTFTAPGGGASGTFANLTATTTVSTGSTGVATATVYTANTVAAAAAYAVSATSGVLTPVSFSETNVAGTATKDVVTAGNNQSEAVNTAFGTLLSATVEDQYGNPVLTSGTPLEYLRAVPTRSWNTPIAVAWAQRPPTPPTPLPLLLPTR